MALVGLAIAAGAGAYYFYVYLPETESKPAKVVQAPAKPPVIANKPRNIAKPLPEQSPPIASAVAAAPVQLVSAPPQMPVQEQQPESAKPEIVLQKQAPAVKKSAPKKPRHKSRPVKLVNTGKPDVPEFLQQVTPPASVILPEPVAAAAEPTINTPKYNDMLTAALRGDQEGVRQLLELGRWVDKPGSSGLTPLMAGIMNGDIQMVQLLLEHGAEPTVQALDLARKKKDAAMVKLLEQHSER
ncbi:MAG: ankyrin repeat domain-containing protein [Pseudomonadota bacterium]